MKVLVIGSGGNGQTYFMGFLKKNKIDLEYSYIPEVEKC